MAEKQKLGPEGSFSGRARGWLLRRLGLALLATQAGMIGMASPRADTLAEACAARADAGDFRTCTAAVAQRPADARLRRLLAISLQKAGYYEESLREYARVAELTPTRFRAQYELGWMLAFVRRYDEAVRPLQRAAQLRPTHTGVYRALTITFAMLRRPAQALQTALAGARLGDRIAMFDAARHYRNGLGVAKNPRRALMWLDRAARAGHVKAMDDLVQVYLNGELGEKPDDAKAEFWAEQAHRARTR